MAYAELTGGTPLVVPIQVQFDGLLPGGFIVTQWFRIGCVFTIAGFALVALTAGSSKANFDLIFRVVTVWTLVHAVIIPHPLFYSLPAQNSGNVVDYNLYFTPAGGANSEWQWKNVSYQGFDGYRTASGNDAHSLFADPLFVAETGLDFHLQAGSPAIDSGENLAEAGSLDFDGGPRVRNGAVDRGALESTAVIGSD